MRFSFDTCTQVRANGYACYGRWTGCEQFTRAVTVVALEIECGMQGRLAPSGMIDHEYL